MNRFTIEQSEIELESKFASRLWSVVHDVPVLYEALLEELAYVGLSSMDLRPDAGNGSVGGVVSESGCSEARPTSESAWTAFASRPLRRSPGSWTPSTA